MTGTVLAATRGVWRRHRRVIVVQALLTVVLFVAAVAANDAYRRAALAEHRMVATALATSYASRLGDAVNGRLSFVRAFEAFAAVAVERGHLEEEFPAFSAHIVESAPGVLGVALAPGFMVSTVFPSNCRFVARGTDLLRDGPVGFDAAIQRTVRSRDVAMTAPVPLPCGARGLVAHQAIFLAERAWGSVVVAFDLDVLLDEALPGSVGPLGTAVRDAQGTVIAGDPALFGGTSILEEVRVPDRGWTVAMAPPAGWKGALQTDAAYARFVGLIVTLGLLLELSVFLLLERRVALERLVEERTAALSEARRIADRRASDLEKFAYVTAHDLQEPLRAISSFTQLLARRLGRSVDEESASYMEQTVNATRRLKLLMRDVQLYLAEEKIPLPSSPICAGGILDEVKAMLEDQIRSTGATIVHGPLPRVHADHRRLREILHVLLSNAMQHRHPARRPEIAVTAAIDDGMARLTVSDNGLGIDPRYADQVFEVFRRLGPRDGSSGTGMGLAIARKMAERLGGGIDFVSDPGQGSAFTVHLPCPSP